MTMNSSPYILSNWVEGVNFYGRTESCEALMTSHERCIYLMGMRRVGKTSLLKRLAGLLSPLALYCDLMQTASQVGEQGMLDESRLVRLLRRELRRLTDYPGQDDNEEQASQRTRLRESRAVWDRDVEHLVLWLEEVSWAWEESNLVVTLLWDEAEMLRRLPTATLMNLRAVLQHSASLRIIICASKGLAALNDHWREAGVSPFLFGFKPHYIAGLTDQAADLLIRQRGQVHATREIVTAIQHATGNHPFLLQTLCDRLYEHGRLREPRSEDVLVEPMLADLFRIDVEHLSPGEQSIMLALAQHGALTSDEIQQHTSLPAEMLQSFAHGMLQLGYLRTSTDGNGRWQVGNEFLARWLCFSQPHTDSSVTDQASLEVVDAEHHTPLHANPLEEPLSEREREVLLLLSGGQRNPEIARTLTISENTVKAHVKNIYRKLGVSDRVQAINRARELGLLS